MTSAVSENRPLVGHNFSDIEIIWPRSGVGYCRHIFQCRCRRMSRSMIIQYSKPLKHLLYIISFVTPFFSCYVLIVCLLKSRPLDITATVRPDVRTQSRCLGMFCSCMFYPWTFCLGGGQLVRGSVCFSVAEDNLYHNIIVPDPAKGVCADPVNGVAILERGDQISKAGTRSVSWAQIREEERRDRMGRRQEVKEDDPFMVSRCQHAQSKLMCTA